MIVVGLAGLALSGCQQYAGNAAGNAVTNATADSAAPKALEPDQSAARRAEDEAGNATGPVALATDASLPETCRRYVATIQACITRVSGTSSTARFRERHLRSGLHRQRTETWPGWARADYLERGCSQQLENIDTTYPDYGC